MKGKGKPEGRIRKGNPEGRIGTGLKGWERRDGIAHSFAWGQTGGK